MDDRIALLKKNWLLAALPDQALEELIQRTPKISFQAGEVIFHDGDTGTTMYIIESGAVDIIKHASDHEVLLATFHAGDAFGEMALIEDAPRVAMARASSDVVLLEMDKPAAISILTTRPESFYQTVRVLSSRLRQADLSRITELLRKNAELQEAYSQLQAVYQATLATLSTALDLRDRATEGHSQRVTAYSLLIAEEMGIAEETLKYIRFGALLHDIGKIGVSDLILRKPGKLTDDEWIEMRHHPTWGKQVLKDIEFLREASEIVYAHHEKFNGKGYPRGLKGEEIPIGARIFAIADVFDALTLERPYRSPIPPEVARDEIVKDSGEHFDPKAVAAFLRVFPQIVETMQQYVEIAMRPRPPE
ncbi:MAG: cyclic nucleotide-binding domain-containing protein [Chloroflexi bacterium]|nr:cyclic nucleotide-binding domain-containing protein [Chloroflexota bacterium]MBI3734508.1 cyclic nucleotide-binding domain-containing protein [Chloroflexota bacterium]